MSLFQNDVCSTISHPAQKKAVAGFTANQWQLLALLGLSVHVNHFDRTVLSVAAPALSTEFSISPAELGLLFSAFSLAYSVALLPAGWLVDRYNPNWVLGLGLFAWSIATLLTGFSETFYGLFACRLLLGIGESVAYPAYSKMLAGSVSEEQRGFANALIDVGAKIGPGMCILVGGGLLGRFGWRTLFIALGVLGLIWILPWIRWAPHQNLGRSADSEGPGIWQIVRLRNAWGTFVGHFCANYFAYILMTWLPYFLVKQRNYPTDKMAVWASIPFIACAVSSLLAGWLSDRWVTRGASPTFVRKAFVVTGLVAPALLLPAVMLRNQTVAMGLVTLALLMFGLFGSNFMAITQRLAGSRAAGSWTGIQTCLAGCAGFVSPFVTGLIVSKTGSFFLAFLSASLALVFGALSYLFIVQRVDPVEWRSSS